jgi:hypothetical protein
MCESSAIELYRKPSRIQAKSRIRAANSLFWKILRVTAEGSIFCPERARSAEVKPNGIKDLRGGDKKNFRDLPPSGQVASAGIRYQQQPELL